MEIDRHFSSMFTHIVPSLPDTPGLVRGGKRSGAGRKAWRAEPRDKLIAIRVSAHELQALQVAAGIAGQSLSAYIRGLLGLPAIALTGIDRD